jgi:pilus assembly protein CpaE
VTFGEVPAARTVVSSKPMSSPSSSSDQTRLLIVEDVPQVAQYIRGLLNAQSAIKVLDVLSDGGKAVAAIGQLRPDVVLVDALLQGRIKGPKLVEQIRDSGAKVPVIVLTVPQNPVEVDPAAGVHGVLSMPFSGYDLMNRVSSVRKEFAATTASGAGRVISVFAPKGGVGKTTIAFNLAVALGQQEHQTVLIDGSLQFGDLRALLKVPVDAPSILDLPTDRIAESDLADVLWRDPSGIDILLAPPRVEMAEMVNPRDIDKILSLLRRVYQATIIDMSATISDVNLAFLDASDTIVEIVTYDSTTIHNTIAMADTFRSIGYPASKVRYLVNRADSAGGIDPGDLQRALGRIPEHSVVSDGQLVVRSNNEGVPFVLADPNAMVSQDMARTAAELMDSRIPVGAGRR